ncbi:MAG: hypothetical protein GXP02_04435 [Alphaproteobacteria bacterium]|nr:hypothetical protein [Alphaproteobacteria bacterium]
MMRIFRLKFFLVVMVGLLLGGCGFSPMYGQFANGKGDLRDIMANIRVAEITEQGRPSRIGQVIRNNLLDNLTPFGETKSAEYILKVTFLVEQRGYGIRKDEAVTLRNLKLVTTYQLESVATSKVIMESAARALVTYDLVQSDYSNMVARQAAMKRLAGEVATQIATRIGAYFNKKAQQQSRKKPAQ